MPAEPNGICAGPRLHIGDEGGKRRRRHRGAHGDDERARADDRHRLEVFHRIEGRRGGERRHGDLEHRREQQRVAIGRRLEHALRRDDAGGAGRVLDDEGLFQRLLQPLRHQPRQHVGDAAGGERHHHGHRPLRPRRLRRRRGKAKRGEDGADGHEQGLNCCAHDHLRARSEAWYVPESGSRLTAAPRYRDRRVKLGDGGGVQSPEHALALARARTHFTWVRPTPIISADRSIAGRAAPGPSWPASACCRRSGSNPRRRSGRDDCPRSSCTPAAPDCGRGDSAW